MVTLINQCCHKRVRYRVGPESVNWAAACVKHFCALLARMQAQGKNSS
jgi:hypothetical protein